MLFKHIYSHKDLISLLLGCSEKYLGREGGRGILGTEYIRNVLAAVEMEIAVVSVTSQQMMDGW